VVRGLHFQWNPYMGKLVRTVRGHMIDLVLDIRKGSQTCGQIIAHDMPSRENAKEGQWIYVPPGFAHGNFFPEDTIIEYFCTGEYSQGCEAVISPLDPELDWGKCPPALRETVQDALRGGNIIISEKDKNGLRLRDWMDDARSDNFVFGKC
jgi:dTDP-4-dehydrorhamnose 3,5-epimerase